MRILITAGNTQTPLDRVRAITNIFTGRTGLLIALEAQRRGHAVALVTSHPELLPQESDIEVVPYRTYDDLAAAIPAAMQRAEPDAIIHAAAISDYTSAGMFAPAPGAAFDEASGRWTQPATGPALQRVDRSKLKSSHAELWLRLTPTQKLVDQFRAAWGFRGVLVKFKLEVGLNDEELIAVAETARRQSSADLMVANTLEGMSQCAFLGSAEGYRRVERPELAKELLGQVESLHRARIA